MSIKSETIELDKIYKEAVHRPRSKAGNVYYRTYREESSEDNLIKNDIEIKQTMDKSNSPTNIRRVWFSMDNVVIEYYASPLVGNSKLVYTIKLSKNLHEYVGRYLQTIGMSKEQRVHAASSTNMYNLVDTSGQVFDSLVSTWEASNIEEIYFDSCVFMGEGTESVVPQRINILTASENKSAGAGIVELKIRGLFGLGRSIDVNKKFPRLATVCFISNLSDIISGFGDKFGDTVEKFKKESITGGWHRWIDSEYVKQAISKLNSSVVIDRIRVPQFESMDNFTIRKQYYVFDDVVLEAKIKSIVEAVREAKIKELTTSLKKGLDETNVVKGSVEEMLINIEKELGRVATTHILKVAAIQMSREELSLVFGAMSTSNKKYYMDMLEEK